MVKPKVSIITPGTFAIPSQKSSSVETVIVNVSRYLGDAAVVHVFGRKTKRQSKVQRKNGITYIRPKPYHRKTYLTSLIPHVRRVKPDIIQVENRPLYASRIKKIFPQKRVWLSLHSTTFIALPYLSTKKFRHCLRSVDKVIVNSQFLKGHILRLAPGTENKIDVNYLGVDPSRFVSRWLPEQEAKRNQDLQRLGYAGRKIILFAGRLIRKKGVHYLLKAMPEVISQHPEVLLLIVGGAFYGSNKVTPYVRQLRKISKSMKEHVRFIPYAAYDEMPGWYRLADIVVVPSNDQEAFGLVNVEAMAAGIPVIATKGGGMKEIIEHGQTGFLVDHGRIERELQEYLHTLLEDPVLQKKMGENSVKRVEENFTWKRTAERLVAMYRSVI